MAKFIGSDLKSDNWGEDYLINKLIEYFDDSYVIYRNRPIFGAQFDVCLIAPNIGIIIFEVKAWTPDTILRIENGDSIVIKSSDNYTGLQSETKENPTTQVRGYVYKMRSKIRQKTGKMPLIYGMVCFPNISKDAYEKKGIAPICEYEETIFKDDLDTRGAFLKKMNLCIKNHKNAAKYNSPFNSELLFRVRQIFETDLKIEDLSIENTDVIDHDDKVPNKVHYSLLAYIPHDENAKRHIVKLAQAYSSGTKLYLFVSDSQELYLIQSAIEKALSDKGLTIDSLNLKINFSNIPNENHPNLSNYFSAFNCSVYMVPQEGMPHDYFTVKDGKIDPEIIKVLQYADAHSNFNIEQYRIEHCDTTKNVIVRAGAGTGKTFTMISRIAFICHTQLCAMKEMANRIVMITFTDDAANQMEEKIKEYFNNYYLLTGDTDCLAFINQIEGMQISTIHSYAKKIISQLGIEFGYGADVSITSGNYKIKKIIEETVDSYVVEMQQKRGSEYVRRLGMPIYQINKDIFNMITRLHNQSVDGATLNKESFGNPVSEEGLELHELITAVVPQIEKTADSYYVKENQLHLSNMMSLLKACIDDEKNVKRLLKMQTGRPQFMFVDEFQDTDDNQINALTKVAELLQYKLFVVGDVKQCIYRFRGAKENAFEQLKYENNPNWLPFSLTKNYRTDKYLLDLFHNTFASMGAREVGDEQLLIYGGSESKESGKLTGTCIFNESCPKDLYYRKISISDEAGRMPALFDEIKYQIEYINLLEKRSGKQLDKKEREIAILVRENWQAELIKKEGKSRGVEIITNTGGDLYVSEPALDMLTLANALLHYDEPDYLYAFVISNFIGGGTGGSSKSNLYLIKEDERKGSWKKSRNSNTTQHKELWRRIDRELSKADETEWNNWKNIVSYLRIMPVLQVLRKIYQILKPWVNYGQESKFKQNNYRLNVDLLFEEMIKASNSDSLTINSLVDILSANIVTRKNVDSREPASDDVKTSEIIVRCITVHKAKGLEYGAVILPYCSDQISKMKRTDINVSVFNGTPLKVGYQIKYNEDHMIAEYANDYFDENLEKSERMREEARILYVAMTRAIRAFSWLSLEGKSTDCWQNLIWEG